MNLLTLQSQTSAMVWHFDPSKSLITEVFGPGTGTYVTDVSPSCIGAAAFARTFDINNETHASKTIPVHLAVCLHNFGGVVNDSVRPVGEGSPDQHNGLDEGKEEGADQPHASA